MAFTDNCDLFGAAHEHGANRVIRHIMRQRPSLFKSSSRASGRRLMTSNSDASYLAG
jgi:hypothetical protein